MLVRIPYREITSIDGTKIVAVQRVLDGLLSGRRLNLNLLLAEQDIR